MSEESLNEKDPDKDKDPADKEKNKKERVIINLNEEKLKQINSTYSLYADESYKVEKLDAPKEERIEPTPTLEVKKKIIPPPMEEKKPKEVDSLKALKPELQKPIRSLLSSVSKEQIKKLTNPTEEQKQRLFNKKGSNTFGELSEHEKAILIKKMDEWKVNEEVAEINASVAISWINNVGTDKGTPTGSLNKDKNTGNLKNTGKLNNSNV